MTLLSTMTWQHDPRTDTHVSTNALASMLIGAVVLELMILRIGTRTAVHIPGIEAVRGPYQIAAAAGRLAFGVAVVLLVVLLARLANDLRRLRRDYLSAAVFGFGLAALLRKAEVIDRDMLAAVTITAVLVLALGVVGVQDWFTSAPIGLFAVAVAIAATSSVLYSESGILSTATLGWLTMRSEELAVVAAICSGPLVRRGLGLAWMPPSRLGWMAAAAAGLVLYATRANPSSAHILMLWNFGFTGALPAVVYSVAAASLVVSIGSAYRHDSPGVTAALVLLPLGGIGLISSYQSGLTVAGLALAAASSDGLVTKSSGPGDTNHHDVIT